MIKLYENLAAWNFKTTWKKCPVTRNCSKVNCKATLTSDPYLTRRDRSARRQLRGTSMPVPLMSIIYYFYLWFGGVCCVCSRQDSLISRDDFDVLPQVLSKITGYRDVKHKPRPRTTDSREPSSRQLTMERRAKNGMLRRVSYSLYFIYVMISTRCRCFFNNIYR